jgi:hypothetical protein
MNPIARRPHHFCQTKNLIAGVVRFLPCVVNPAVTMNLLFGYSCLALFAVFAALTG